MTLHPPSLAQELASALAWWQAAGVDCDFADDATTWLAPEAPAEGAAPGKAAPASPADGTAPALGMADKLARRNAPPPASPAAPAAPRRDYWGDSPPADLAAFRQWWMETPGLAPATGFARVPPRGAADAELMILVPQPEAGDRESLLSGPQGRLLANILAAMGLDESRTYIASALPCHTPMADLAAMAAGGMDAVTERHVGLVTPRRLLVLGKGLAPMFGSAEVDALREINHTGRKVPVMTSETLDAMMDMPRLKARFWRRWMEWSATI